MYYINKVVGVLMSPSVMGLVVLAALILFRAKRRYLWIVLGLLWFWTSAIPGRILGLPLEREWLVDGDIPTAESFPKADAIVCLGGGMTSATNVVHGANICPASDRAWMAARLWKAGKAPKVICTGGSSRASTLGLLMDFGVPESAVTFMEKARNTEEEAKEIATLLLATSRTERASAERKSERRDTAYSRRDPEEELPSARVLVVTSAWHMRRAKLMFEKYAKGVEIIPAPTDFEATVFFDSGFDFRELQPGTAFMNEYYLREWIGYLGYKWLRR